MRTVYTVFVKEILEFLRDTRSVIITFILPFVLFPVIFTILGSGKERPYTVYVRDNSELAEALSRNERLDVRDAGDTPADDLLTHGEVLIEGRVPQTVLTVNNRSKASLEAGAILEKSLQNPQYSVKFLYDSKEAGSFIFLSFLLPVLFSVISVNGPSTAAAHLMGGEKERNTLESLFSTRAPRPLIIAGKYFALYVIGLFSSMAYFGGLTAAYYMNSDISPGTMALLNTESVIILLLLFSSLLILTSSIEILISTAASTSRETLLLILPLTVLFLALSYYAQEIRTVSGIIRYLPVISFSIAVRDVISGTAAISGILRVIAVNIILSFPFLAGAMVHAGRERVICRH